MSWTKEQKNVTIAAYLGWTLDAFDFFLMVFMFKDIAAEFHVGIPDVSIAVVLTLAMRPIGALIFGRLADRFGRRPTLMANILAYSVLELASGFAPSLMALLVLRALFGIAMGGEWGVGSALTMETIPPKSRGFVSGLLQAGYPSGYLLASVVFGLFYDSIGWRGMFMVGVVPALLVVYVRSNVTESPAWEAMAKKAASRPVENAARQLETVAVCDRHDDCIQLFQPRHAGHLPDLPARATPIRYAHHIVDHHRAEYRCSCGRHQFRQPFGKNRTPQGDLFCGPDRVAGAAFMGLCEHAVGACRRRLPDADFGARRLGRNPGAFERDFAR